MEMCQRVLSSDGPSSANSSLEALIISCFIDMAAYGSDVAEKLSAVSSALSKHESHNASLHYNVARLFSRLCGRSRSVLQTTVKLAGLACDLSPTSSLYRAELAYQHRLSGSFGQARDTYRDACDLDAGNVTAVHGTIYCQVMQGLLEDAEQQLEFLTVVNGGDDADKRDSEVAFLHALLAFRKEKDPAKHQALLGETVNAFAAEKKRVVVKDVLEEYCSFNPDFMIEIAREYLLHLYSPSNVSVPGAESSVSAPVQCGLDLLERVVSLLPAALGAHLALAKAAFEMKQYDKSLSTVTHCLNIAPTHSGAHLQLAQLHLATAGLGGAKLAHRALEQALSYDFTVRSSPVYQLVKSECLAASGDLDGARMQLEDTMKIPGVRDGLGGSGGLTISDRVSIFVQLANVYSRLNMLSEANNVLAEGKAAFEGTADQIKILVAISDLAIRKNDFTTAINMLSSVPPDSMLHTHAQVAKADIYLKYRHDKQAFAQCYVDLVAARKNAANYVLLGEAYMQIQAPESAIEAYENALKLNPKDSRLAEKIGRALVSTHDYRKAQDYYENALKISPSNLPLRYDRSKLSSKLRMFEPAARVLKKALSGVDIDGASGGGGKDSEPGDEVASQGAADVKSMAQDVVTLLNLVDVYVAAKQKDEAKSALAKALKAQRIVAANTAKGGGDLVASGPVDPALSGGGGSSSKASQKRILADICFKMAKMAESEHDDGQATTYYGEALAAYSSHEASMVALSKLQLRTGKLTDCEETCNTLLRVGGAGSDATMIMGDLQFMKSNFEGATVQYRALLGKNANNYHAMEKLVQLLRRGGKLDEVPALFKKAEESDPRASSHAGLFYVKGCYHRFNNSVTEAIKHFNLARKDGEWGRKSLEMMIEIYVNPDGSNMWEEAEAGGPNEGNSESVRVAEKLLKELEGMGEKTPHHRILECYHLLATRQKVNLDRAMAYFIEVLEEDKDNLPALLGISTAFMFEKAGNKARNYLKRIAKMPYDQDHAEEFEKAYLMLGDIYVGRGKFDLAQDLCKKALGFNKSCAGAWELMGVVMEKEQSYKDAADCYEKSWGFEHEASAAVGFKLAFNYLKAKRYVEAIDICNKVLQQYPDYPRIRNEILERAMQSLRP